MQFVLKQRLSRRIIKDLFFWMAHKPPDIPLLALISNPDVDEKAIKTSYIILQDPTDKRLCVSRSLV